MNSYFSAYELRCRCHTCECAKCKYRNYICDAEPISIRLLMMANTLRVLYGKPINLNSARRCRYWNTHEGGAEKSQHPKGKAMDIREPDFKEQDRLVELAEKVGFGGIFTYDWGVHVDDGPPNRRGSYRSKK